MDRRGSLPPIKRRHAIGMMIAGAAIFAAGDTLVAHTNGNALSTRFWEHVETDTLGKDPVQLQSIIENKFGVTLLPRDDPEEIAAKFGADPNLIRATMPLRISWDAPRLVALGSTLDILPPNFYSPSIPYNNKLEPLKFSLYEDYAVTSNSAAEYDAIRHEINLIRFWLNQTRPNQLASKQKVVHELTHAATNIVIDNNGITFNESEKRLKSSIEIQTQDQLRDTFRSIITEEDDPLSIHLKKWTGHVGYGASNFREFWAVAAEYYVAGADEFITQYQPFLGEKRSLKLYEGLKDELFQGREYRNGLLLAA